MRRIWLTGASVVAVALTWIGGWAIPASAVDEVEQLQVLNTEGDPLPGDPLPVIPVEIATGETEGSAIVQLDWVPSGDAPSLPGITVSVFVPGATASLLTPAPPAGFTLTRASRIPLAISVTGVESEPLSDGLLLAEVNGQAEALATIDVTKAAGPEQVAFLGATDAGLTSVVHGAEASIPVTLRNTARVPVNFDVGVTPFLSATGRSTPSTLSKEPDEDTDAAVLEYLDIRAGQSVDVWIHAELVELGQHTTTLTITVEGQAGVPILLVVDRQSAPLDMTLTQPAKTFLDLYPDLDKDLEVVDATSAGAGVVVQNESDLPAILTFSVSAASRKQGSSVQNTDVDLLSVACRLESDSSTSSGSGESEESEGGDEAEAQIESRQLSCTVDPGVPTGVEATFTPFSAPGEYAITLVATDSGGGAVSTTVTVLVRYGPWVAAVVLVVGVVIATFGNYWLSRKRVQAKRQLALSSLSDKVMVQTFPAGDLWADDVRQSILQRLGELQDLVDANDPSPGDFERKLEYLERRVSLLPDWLRCLNAGRLAGLQSLPELNEVRDVIVSVGPIDDAETKLERAKFSNAWKHIRVAALVKDLIGVVDAWKLAVPSANASAIGPALEAAQAAIAAAQWDVAQTKANEALSEWRKQVRASLTGAMKPGALPAAGHSEWANAVEIAGNVREALLTDIEPDVGELWSTAALAWRTLIGVRLDLCVAEIAKRDKEDPNSDRYKQAQDAKPFVTSARDQMQARVGQAEETLSDAVAALFPAAPALGFVATGPVDEPAAFDPQAQPAGPTPRIQSREAALKWYKRLELVALLLVATVAVLWGLVANYEPNQTWGSLNDIVGTLLWGFGISAAGQFTGLAALRKALLGET